MDTTYSITSYLIKDSDSLHLVDLTEDERNLICDYVSLTRDIIEANQLFDVFIFNLHSLRSSFELNANDIALKTEHCPKDDTDFIEFNALVISLISSAKTFTEFLRETAAHWLCDGKDRYKDEFNIYVSKIYDKSVNYRFLINLRNFMQHGYLPISLKAGIYSFDVNQIVDMPHFRVNGKLKADIDKFRGELQLPGGGIACLSVTLTLAEFAVRVIDIYRQYLFCFKERVSIFYQEVMNLIEQRPDIICDYHKDFCGYIFYDLDEHGLHAINTVENPCDMIEAYEKKCSCFYDNEKKAYEKIHGCFTHLSCKSINS